MNEDYTKGKVYTGTVDRISSSGNAIIDTGTDHINLGSGTKSVVGKTVAFEYKGGYSGEQVPMKEAVNKNPIGDSGSNKNDLLSGHL